MKILYFISSVPMTDEDAIKIKHFREDGHKVIAVDGRQTKGFQDACNSVYLSGDFPHVEKWAVGAGIEVMKPEPVVESKPEPKQEEPKPRRGRRKVEPEQDQDAE